MKVLWVTNTIFPDLSIELNRQTPVVGGWMYGMAKALVKNGVELIVATTRPNMQSYHSKINGIEYYLLNAKTSSFYYDQSLEEEWKAIITKTSPLLIHVHGTEYAHALPLIQTCPEQNYVVSIQGLLRAVGKHYESGISKNDIRKNRTFKDLIKSSSISQAKKEFQKRAEQTESSYFRLVKNFIGRTKWDYAQTKAINPNVNYFFCNESLRDSFYSSKKWSSDNKKDHTIFLSQAGYPLKGLHQVIKAAALLIDEFPNIKIRIAGNDILKSDTLKEKIRLDGYGNYLIKLLRKTNLTASVDFLGFLNEKEMISEYLRAHVFICPSSIENSPNSLGEAQLLGVPCIGSYVGGIPDMIAHEKTGLLYRFEDIEMMSQHIKTIFTNFEIAEKISLGGITEAAKRHDRSINLDKLLSTYTEIIAQEKTP